MISFRYHIVTIVAIFLALAVGLLAGSAFVEPGLVDQLRGQTDRLTDQLAARGADLDDARASLDAYAAFVDASLQYLTSDRLLGEQVVLVSQEGVEDGVLAQAQRSLDGAGADVLAVFSARNDIASQDAGTQTRLAQAIGDLASNPEDLPAAAASALASRLADDGGADAPDGDLLARLVSDGFLVPVGSLSDEILRRVGAPGQIVVVLGGGQDESPGMPPEAFAVPLVRSLSSLGVPVAAGESATTAVPFVQQVRDGGADATVTVDDLDLSIGGAALVLGLDELMVTGEGGAYGMKDGADPLPPRS